MIINCTWTHYNYNIFKLDLNNNNNHAALWNFWGWKLIYVPYSSSVTSNIETFGKDFNLFALCLYSHFFLFFLFFFLFFGIKFVSVKIYCMFFHFQYRSHDHLGGLLLARRLKSSACRYNFWFPISLNTSNSIYHRLEMDTPQETIILHGREKNWKGSCVICIY